MWCHRISLVACRPEDWDHAYKDSKSSMIMWTQMNPNKFSYNYSQYSDNLGKHNQMKKKKSIFSITVRYQHVNCAVWVYWLPKDIFMVAWDATHNKMQNHICLLSLNCCMMFTQPLFSGMCQTHGWIKRTPAKYIHFLKLCKLRTLGMHNSTSLLKVSLTIFLFVTRAM